jgi:hypothetical protein
MKKVVKKRLEAKDHLQVFVSIIVGMGLLFAFSFLTSCSSIEKATGLLIEKTALTILEVSNKKEKDTVVLNKEGSFQKGKFADFTASYQNDTIYLRIYPNIVAINNEIFKKNNEFSFFAKGILELISKELSKKEFKVKVDKKISLAGIEADVLLKEGVAVLAYRFDAKKFGDFCKTLIFKKKV